MTFSRPVWETSCKNSGTVIAFVLGVSRVGTEPTHDPVDEAVDAVRVLYGGRTVGALVEAVPRRAALGPMEGNDALFPLDELALLRSLER